MQVRAKPQRQKEDDDDDIFFPEAEEIDRGNELFLISIQKLPSLEYSSNLIHP